VPSADVVNSIVPLSGAGLSVGLGTSSVAPERRAAQQNRQRTRDAPSLDDLVRLQPK
jgi:hypothetical protein